MKRFLAIVIGLIAGFIVISGIEWISGQIFSLPDNIDINNYEEMKKAMESMPFGALLFILFAYVAGSFTAGLVAAKISAQNPKIQGLILGGIFTVMGIINITMIPHPVWFMVFSLLIYIPCVFLGIMVAGMISGKSNN